MNGGKFHHLSEREELGEDEIIERFFATSSYKREQILDLWSEISSVFDVPKGLLRPTDRFGLDIGENLGVDDDIADLQIAARARGKRVGQKVDLSGLRSIEDYIRYFCEMDTEARKDAQ